MLIYITVHCECAHPGPTADRTFTVRRTTVASTSRTTRRPLVIAAACVVVIGLLAAVLALATRGDSPTPTAASSPSATASPDLPDTAVAYRAAKDGGGIALVGTYQQSGFEELGGTSQLFDHWGRFTQNPTAVKVDLSYQ